MIAGIIDIDQNLHDVDFFDFESISIIHKYLFGELYSCAGEFRTINIYKNEKVLNGLSISYSHHSNIKKNLSNIFLRAQNLDWSHDNPKLPLIFANLMVDIWRVHPFREGNTRTILVFMKLFSEQNHLNFNSALLSLHTGFLRNSLVLAAVQEAPEISHLLKIILDALTTTPPLNQKKISSVDSEKYRSIGKYEVSKYEEKPFYTNNPKQD